MQDRSRTTFNRTIVVITHHVSNSCMMCQIRIEPYHLDFDSGKVIYNRFPIHTYSNHHGHSRHTIDREDDRGCIGFS
jgi:hypothetical protein